MIDTLIEYLFLALISWLLAGGTVRGFALNFLELRKGLA